MDTETLRRRTANSIASHRKRARMAGCTLDYTLDDLRKKAEEATYCLCKYCKDQVTADNFACDHETPTSRGGSFAFWNVFVICGKCNLAKGVLTGQEFGDIVALMRDWPDAVRIDFLARLRAGGGRFR